MMLLDNKNNSPSPTNTFIVKRTFIYMIVLMLVYIIVCGFYLHYSWNKYQYIASSEAMTLGESIESFLDIEDIAKLSGQAADEENPEYIMMKNSLFQLVENYASINFAYLLRINGDNIDVLVSSIPPGSPHYLLPGQSQRKMRDEIKTSLLAGQTVISSPKITNRGSNINVLVPVKDPNNCCHMVAILGIAYSTDEWHLGVLQKMIPDLIIVFGLLLLLLALMRTWHGQIILKEISKKIAFDEALYHSVFDQASIGIAIVDGDYVTLPREITFLYTNPMFNHILGRSNHQLQGVRWDELIHPDDQAIDFSKKAQLDKNVIDCISSERRVIKLDGSSVWVNLKISLFIDATLDTSYLLLLEDISARKDAEESLKESERSKSVIFSHLRGMAYQCSYDQKWTMQFVSAGCEELTGYLPENLLSNHDISFNEVIAPEYRQMIWHEWARILPQAEHFRFEYEIITKTGERKWVLELGQGIYGDNAEVIALEGIIFDISEQKKHEAEIAYLSEHDFLTGLYNRSYLEKEKIRLNHPEHYPLAIAICDIDGLRLINDAYGFAEGDLMIMVVATLIESCCRPGDILGRVGGDEFMLFMPNTDNNTARQQMELIRDTIDAYNRTKRPHLYELNVSMGYSIKESNSLSIDEVINNAEDILKHRKLINQKSSHYAIVSTVMATLYAKSQETEEHGQRLARLTSLMGDRLGLELKAQDDLQLLSRIHDIGKIGIDDQILNKPDKLTDEEWEQMKKHPEVGYRIAMSTPELEHIAIYILHHHERYDGKGYPFKLKGEEIPLLSRILSVVDAYDAMTEDRIYRRALSAKDALEEIIRCAGTQFDPDIVKLFVELITELQGRPLDT